jgi:t-SNARE complex subunit (syntaxin)
VLVVQALRENLARIGRDFKLAVDERADKLERYHKRRRAICAQSKYVPMNTIYSMEAENSKHNVQILEEINRDELTAVQSIESRISDIAKIFSQLSELIETQDYDVIRIDQETERAVNNVEKVQRQLQDFYKKAKGNKILICKIVIVIVVFALVFVLII